MTGKTYEPPLYLEMDFGEALERFGATDPKEVKQAIEKAKKKKPPGSETPTTSIHQKATPSGGKKRRSAQG